MVAEAASVLGEGSELLSTYPSTLDPGEVPSWYRITVRLGINRGSLGLPPSTGFLVAALRSTGD
jgi:hypothetical protein